MNTNLLASLALATGLLVPTRLSAQFAIDWFTVEGGGGTSGGGAYQLSGTAGQPEATAWALETGLLLVGGFWSIALEGPRLTIELLPDLRTLKVSWPRWASDYVLEQRVALPDVPEADWPTDVPTEGYQADACHYYLLVPAASGTLFYRLHQVCPAP
jgi:hypothetical protein